MFSITTATSVLDNFRAIFAPTPDASMSAPTGSDADKEAVQAEVDKSRYARILENERDRQHLTDVERFDMDMIERVRSALYQPA